jgi:hypothetical protein
MIRHGKQALILDLSLTLVVIALSAPRAKATIIIGIRTPEEIDEECSGWP